MSSSKAPMALTAELVSLVARVEPDPGPIPGVVHHSEQDYDDPVASLLARHRSDEFRVFAYGSLIWKPEFEFVEHEPATAKGWHRSFCIKIPRWRGTPGQPGLMMTLDRGGQCAGVAYRLPDDNWRDRLGRLVRREITAKPPTNAPRWIRVKTGVGDREALAFTANPKGHAYVRDQSPEQIAWILARAAGHWGSGAEYLYQTITHLDSFGIRDRNLWRLQELVAREIVDWKGATKNEL
jgi:glutathione-specific gamma-glutamylcyclotransferase